MTEYVQYRVENRVCYITLNRPDKRNALNDLFVTELKKSFNRATFDPDVKVIVLDAIGEVFCAGADLAYLQTLQNNTLEQNKQDSHHLKELYQQIYTLPKVVIACVEGHAIAGGAGLATVCDAVFAVPEASFGYTEVRIGFIPAIVSVFLVRKIGEARAKELLLWGKLIDAQKAHEWGLVTQVAERSEIRKTVSQWASDLCTQTSAQSLETTKQLIATVQTMNYEDALSYAADQNAEARHTDDCKRGIAAFLSKQKLQW